MGEVTENADVDVEVVAVEEPTTVITTGVAAGLMKSVSFAQIDPTLTLAERAPIVRKMLNQANAVEGKLEIVQGELLYEANKNGYWKDYEFTDDTGAKRNYGSWDEFCETELNLKRRSSFTRMKTYEVFCVKLPLSAETLEGLEWSKAALVAPVINEENYAVILEAIDGMTWKQVDSFVKKLKTTEDVAEAAKLATTPKAITLEDGEPLPAGSASASSDDPMKTFSVKLAQAQLENVEAAIKMCGDTIGSESKAHNLDVICTEYLASITAPTGGDTASARLAVITRIIERMESNFGVVMSIDSMEGAEDGGE